MRIQNNISAMNAHRHLSTNNSSLSSNLEKLSSGYAINRAADDAAGLAISEKMRAQITGLEAAEANSEDGISLVQTAEGALTEVHSMLNRMVELAMKASNGTYGESERQKLQDEVDALTEEIDRIAEATNFNGIDLLKVDDPDDFSYLSIGEISLESMYFGDTMPGFSTEDFQIGASGMLGGSQIVFVQQDPAYDIDGYPMHEDGLVTAEYDVLTGDITFSVMGGWNVNGSGGLEVTEDMLLDALDIAFDNAITAGATAEQIEAMDAVVIETEGTFTVLAGSLETVTVIPDAEDVSGIVDGPAVDGSISGTNPNISMSNYTIDNILGGGLYEVTFTEDRTTADREISAEVNAGGTLTITVSGPAGTIFSDAEIEEAIINATINADPSLANLDLSQVLFETANNYGIGLILDSNDTTISAEQADFTSTSAIAETTDPVEYETEEYVAVASATDDAYSLPAHLGGDWAQKALWIQVGNTGESFQQVEIVLTDMRAKYLGVDPLDITTIDSALGSLDKINEAIENVSNVRAYFGAIQNRLDHTISSLGVSIENIQEAESRVRDVDMAAEMMSYTTNNILVQSAQAMLAQANQVPQGVLQLLQ